MIYLVRKIDLETLQEKSSRDVPRESFCRLLQRNRQSSRLSANVPFYFSRSVSFMHSLLGAVQFLFRPRLVSRMWNVRRCAPTFSHVNQKAITNNPSVVGSQETLIIKDSLSSPPRKRACKKYEIPQWYFVSFLSLLPLNNHSLLLYNFLINLCFNREFPTPSFWLLFSRKDTISAAIFWNL